MEETVRPLMEEAFEDVARGRVVVAIAPTSYGKTAASPWMWRRAYEEDVAGGLIHVAPLRSLVRKTFEGFFKPRGGRLQMHGAREEEKAPYMLSQLVVTTLDSFLWNLYRIPVAEALKVQRGVSMGHYYPALLGIYTSLVAFDEAHMYLWENPSGGSTARGFEASLAASSALAGAGVPVIVETATIRPQALSTMTSSLPRDRPLTVKALKAPSSVEGCFYLEELKKIVGGRLDVVSDSDWEHGWLVPWETKVFEESWEGIVGEIVEDASRGPTLAITNTVREAVGLYLKLRERMERVIIIHGRLSMEDREKVEDSLERVEREGGVVVATQVAEAGVDVNSIAVYTSAAPLESLVQRAGRSCRRGSILEHCIEDGGKVVIVGGSEPGPYNKGEIQESLSLVKEALNKGKGIDWRAPCSRDGLAGYGSMLAKLHAAPEPLSISYELLYKYLEADVQPSVLFNILEDLCGLARDSIMVEIEIPESGSTVVASLDWALRHAGKVLQLGVSGAPILIVEYEARGSRGRVEAEASHLWRAWRRARGRGGCRGLVEALLKDASKALETVGERGAALASFKLKAREGAYKRGLGLLLPGEVEEP